MNPRQANLALLMLALSAFAIGTTEFISVGLLPLIADDLHISVATSGLTVTLYALGVTFGAPVLTSLTARVPRKTLLMAVMLTFIVGNGLAAAASGIGVLLTARVISAFAHGVFMSIGSTIAADLVPANRRASAISLMFSGLTVATVTGVPIGTYMGQQWGWRIAFVAIVVIGVISLLAHWTLIPSNLQRGQAAPARLGEQFKLVARGRLPLAFAVTALGYGGTFVVFTYLSPLLQDVSGFKEGTTAAILLLYGVAIAIGNMIGGRAANRRPVHALFYMFILQAIVLLLFSFTAPYQALALVTVFMLGLLAFMSVPGLQVYVVILAERYAPQAKDFASAVNIAAFNAGIAIGAYTGGIVAERLGLIHTAWVGAVMVLGAVILTAWMRELETRDSRSTGEPHPVKVQ